jgi:UDP-MurNAc hydroxylase
MCHEKWQNVALSLREKIVRRPDKFSNILNIFLFSDLEDLRDNLIDTINISNERIMVINDAGEQYEVNRFCPHQGADLCNALITKENILICPRHGWEFDLDKDGVNKSSGETLNSKKISDG